MAKQKKYVGKSNYTSDGATVGAIDEFRVVARTNFPKGFIGRSNYPSDGATVSTIDDFHIVDGEAVWTTDFQPPMPQ